MCSDFRQNSEVSIPESCQYRIITKQTQWQSQQFRNDGYHTSIWKWKSNSTASLHTSRCGAGGYLCHAHRSVWDITNKTITQFPFRTVWRRFLNVITLNTYNCSKGSCLLWSLKAGALKRQLVWEKCWLELLLTSHNGCRIAFFLSRNMAGNSRLSWIFSLLVGLHFLFNLKYRLVVFVSIV